MKSVDFSIKTNPVLNGGRNAAAMDLLEHLQNLMFNK